MSRYQLYMLIIERLIVTVISMLKSLLIALPLGVLTGIICLWSIKIYQKRKNILIKQKKKNAIIAFGSYILIMLQMSILLRPFGKINEIDLIPFNMPGGLRYIILYALANVFVFLPIGILIPLIWDGMRNIKRILLAGFLMSLSIEIFQFILKCGVFQTEDLIVNTVGSGLGYWIYKKYIK